MSDKKLRALGAECVAGDLLLNRQTVGVYRHGQFVITPEGAAALEAAPAEVAPAPARVDAPVGKSRPAKALKGEKAPAPAPAPEAPPEPAATTEPTGDSESADDLVADLDSLLGT